MTILNINHLQCHYDTQRVLHDLNLTMAENDIVCLLGASGCGKTTLLKAIAGLQPISDGEIIFQQTDISQRPIEQRNIGFIFQDYALFPHLTVAENIVFGLHKQSTAEKQQCLEKMLSLVHLQGLENRYPYELSGGQQQRVAIARAIACQPKLLLLDEPFSNIDTQVRQQMIIEMKAILKQQKIAAIFVTHSKEEAFAFADKLAVMAQGKIVQYDTPEQLYQYPNCPFVAKFLGETNYIPCEITADNQWLSLFAMPKNTVLPNKGQYQWLVRPHQFTLTADSNGQGKIINRLFLGQYYLYDVAYQTLTLKVQSPLSLAIGTTISLEVKPSPAVLFSQ